MMGTLVLSPPDQAPDAERPEGGVVDVLQPAIHRQRLAGEQHVPHNPLRHRAAALLAALDRAGVAEHQPEQAGQRDQRLGPDHGQEDRLRLLLHPAERLELQAICQKRLRN